MNIYSKFLTALIITLSFSFNAFALNLQDAKAQGKVGELPTGYIGAIVKSKEVDALVQQVNGKRKQLYLKMARKNNVQLDQIEALAGEKAMKKTRSGHYIQKAGKWIKK